MTRSLRLLFLALVLFASSDAIAQSGPTVGLLEQREGAFNGYTLLTPLLGTSSYLLDMQGRIAHQWDHELRPGAVSYLGEDGRLYRTANVRNFGFGGEGGRLRVFEQDGTRTWDYLVSDSTRSSHHDIELMPNGNVLMIVWERRSKAEALAAGRDSTLISEDGLAVDTVIEVRPIPPDSGEVVWEWRVWDHLVQNRDPDKPNYGEPSDHPERFDINLPDEFWEDRPVDWTHFNSIDYNPRTDQIMLTSPHFAEIYVIDHSTTTEEAAGTFGGNSGSGGDILYRWGSPEAWDMGTRADRKLWFAHDAHWITPGLAGEGNVLIFNNGCCGRPGGDHSSVDEIVLPISAQDDFRFSRPAGEAFRPLAPIWSYRGQPEESFDAPIISGAQRLPNGNTLICEGSKGHIFEVTPHGDVVWSYVNPISLRGTLAQGQSPEIWFGKNLDNLVFRAYRYAPDYPGLSGLDLSPKGTVELPLGTASESLAELPSRDARLGAPYPNPASGLAWADLFVGSTSQVKVSVYDMLGRRVGEPLPPTVRTPGTYAIRIDGDSWAPGIYALVLEADGATHSRMLTWIR